MTVRMRSMMILLAVIAWAPGQAAEARSSSSAVLTEQSGGITKVYAGQPVEIRLKAQAGTGYSWKPTSYTSKIKTLSTKKSSGGMVGGKEVQRFQFKTKNKGTYVLNFRYGQPWKGGAKNAKTRSFTIKVR